MSKSSLLLILLLLHSCSYEFPKPTDRNQISIGSADFSKMVSIGGSWSAGLMDGALYETGQQAAFPNLILRQINESPDHAFSFIQPDVTSAVGINYYEDPSLNAGSYLLEFIQQGSNPLFKNINTGEPFSTFPGGAAVQNVSYPGMRSIDFSNPTVENDYLDRFLGNLGTVQSHVNQLAPSVVLAQIGMEDVLNYVAAGLTGDASPSPTTIGQNDLTPIDAFEDSLRNALQDLISTGADIIVSTIPNFVSFPYFTEFGHLAPISANQANAIFAFYGGFNTLVNQLNAEQGAGARSTVTFFDDNPSSWRMVVEDPNLPDASLSDGTIVPKYRQLNEGELVLWSIPEYPSAQNESSGGLGLQIPITKQYFLSTADLSVADQLILDYNSVIRAVVAEFEGISLVDLYTELNPAVQSEIIFDGVAFDYSMRRTGIFSADGLNLNQRGQAILANTFIKIMNERYQANISTVNPNDFPGNTFRNAF